MRTAPSSMGAAAAAAKPSTVGVRAGVDTSNTEGVAGGSEIKEIPVLQNDSYPVRLLTKFLILSLLTLHLPLRAAATAANGVETSDTEGVAGGSEIK